MKLKDATLGRLLGLVCALAVIVAMPIAAYAADGGIKIPVGDWISAAIPYILALVGGLVTWGLRQLPASVVTLLNNLAAVFGNGRVELLITNAIGVGLNSVANAEKGKTLDVATGVKVLDQALQYAVDNAPAWLLAWAGGPDGLAKKIWGRLDLEPAADASAISLVTTTANAKA